MLWYIRFFNRINIVGMTDTDLSRIYSELLSRHYGGKKHPVTAAFYRTKTLNHSIQLKRNVIYIKISDKFREVPERILFLLGIILFNKLFRINADRWVNKEYRVYLTEHLLPGHTTLNRMPSKRYNPIGKYYDLSTIFDSINQRFFDGAMAKPVLGWSLNKSYSRLGFYSAERNLLVISRIFDHRKVPLEVIEFLMYHEMLHIKIPVETVNGRRRIHPPIFKKLEKQFPEYEMINKWIQKKRQRL